MKTRAQEIEESNIPGIYPLNCDNLNEHDNFTYEDKIKEYLELRSGFEFDMEAIRYIIESARLDAKPTQTIYEFAVKSGLITRMRIK